MQSGWSALETHVVSKQSVDETVTSEVKSGDTNIHELQIQPRNQLYEVQKRLRGQECMRERSKADGCVSDMYLKNVMESNIRQQPERSNRLFNAIERFQERVAQDESLWYKNEAYRGTELKL